MATQKFDLSRFQALAAQAKALLAEKLEEAKAREEAQAEEKAQAEAEKKAEQERQREEARAQREAEIRAKEEQRTAENAKARENFLALVWNILPLHQEWVSQVRAYEEAKEALPQAEKKMERAGVRMEVLMSLQTPSVDEVEEMGRIVDIHMPKITNEIIDLGKWIAIGHTKVAEARMEFLKTWNVDRNPMRSFWENVNSYKDEIRHTESAAARRELWTKLLPICSMALDTVDVEEAAGKVEQAKERLVKIQQMVSSALKDEETKMHAQARIEEAKKDIFLMEKELRNAQAIFAIAEQAAREAGGIDIHSVKTYVSGTRKVHEDESVFRMQDLVTPAPKAIPAPRQAQPKQQVRLPKEMHDQRIAEQQKQREERRAAQEEKERIAKEKKLENDRKMAAQRAQREMQKAEAMKKKNQKAAKKTAKHQH